MQAQIKIQLHQQISREKQITNKVPVTKYINLLESQIVMTNIWVEEKFE